MNQGKKEAETYPGYDSTMRSNNSAAVNVEYTDRVVSLQLATSRPFAKNNTLICTGSVRGVKRESVKFHHPPTGIIYYLFI